MRPVARGKAGVSEAFRTTPVRLHAVNLTGSDVQARDADADARTSIEQKIHRMSVCTTTSAAEPIPNAK